MVTEDAVKERLLSLFSRVIEPMGLELVEFTFRSNRGVAAIEILVDKKVGKVNLDECAAVNRQIVNAIDLNQVLSENYTVEVSSPGLDRPLKSARDFMRVNGAEVRFHLTEAVDGKLEHWGKVENVTEHEIMVKTKSGSVMIPLSKIQKAVQII